MIKIENAEVFGWEATIRGMRNPMNSWEKSDSRWCINVAECSKTSICDLCGCYEYGKNDLTLMKKLCNAGTDHRKFMRMITVYVDVTAPLYWWKEYDTYKVGTVANSCSTMHKIADKEFTLDNFSHEHLLKHAETYTGCSPIAVLECVIDCLNEFRSLYIETKNKAYWWQMIQLLPSSYNQKRTLMLNYEVLTNIYKSRKDHKLDEWQYFCKWIETLPYSELITMKEG